ncbi:BREX-2 system adenine-specific DNA-methyltransferase PglX [Planctellipticum variicoloris]|uniref:BREX-2 system adenine-specific DNA-methyltransferase PglX n=1 Tax=Planctellipticum variicoloris TaxID=3064265 RepID=UPI003013974B|nr:BREX-2 system adenine-specific DNA-methyltransferase PglX [Planctomycetaceae bacterium SH412]
MLDRSALLSDLQKLLAKLEADLLERSASADVPEVGETLKKEFERAQQAERTAQNYEDWRSDAVTQHAAAWVLSAVFVRFLEDNSLIEPPWIAGPGERLQRARDEHELYFRQHPKETDRDYLLHTFDELAGLPGTRDVFGGHNPLRELPNWLSGDAAGELLRFFQKIDANTGALVHDFTDPARDTRFLGDLYQDLSEAARKKYALLQTPEFVEEFILDRTLEPAIEEFGLGPADGAPASDPQLSTLNAQLFRMIDPACGSGHFLLGAFRRILDRWQRLEPGTNVRVLVQRALDSIHGVDVNPYAIAIARFRLLLAALRACGIRRLADAPAFRLNVVCGDSLLHAPLKSGSKHYSKGQLEFQEILAEASEDTECEHAYQSEDLSALKSILRSGTYHAVVANPPYITPNDQQLNERYRRRFHSCHMKYSLTVPFLERIFRLAVAGGYTGQITGNAFMKAAFGQKLIEDFLPTVDLTHVIDTSGAYIPGHGTPTVILLGRNRRPLSSTLRTVMGIKGEPATPRDPSHGLVWSLIVAHIDTPESPNEFVNVSDSSRAQFQKHPWSIGGGGLSQLKEALERKNERTLRSIASVVGVFGMTNADQVILAPERCFQRRKVERHAIRRLILGEELRDWVIDDGDFALFPYGRTDLIDLPEIPGVHRWCWHCRTVLGNRATFNKRTYFEEGRPWWEWHQVSLERLLTKWTIIYAFVSTHNNFILDRRGQLSKETSRIIKLMDGADEGDYLSVLGCLNSSTACFWIKQVCFPKGGDHVGQEGARVRRTLWDERFNFNATSVEDIPLPESLSVALPRLLDVLGQKHEAVSPNSLRRQGVLSRDAITHALAVSHEVRGQMIAAQEELDWECYRLYGLLDEDLTLPEPPALQLGQRAFEIVLARKMAAGETQTTWFARHGSTPITELPADWPADYRRLVERRIELIETDPNIRLIEQPEYKRRWNTEPWESQLERALREWLLDRLESYFDFDGRMNDAGTPTSQVDIGLISVAKLADIARNDPQFQEVGALYRDDPAFDVQRLVEELVAAESVPLLPVLRYKDKGLRNRAEWEKTWDLQRREDAGEAVGTIPVPPKYTSADFLKSDFWRLRGKLDVPKERWVSFPHCDGADGTAMIAWAGYDHLQLAQAISAYYVDVQERLGGRDDPRLPPLLAGLAELVPWLKQWHNAPDAAFGGQAMGDYFEGFVQEEARELGLTVAELKGWKPPAKVGKGRKKTS